MLSSSVYVIRCLIIQFQQVVLVIAVISLLIQSVERQSSAGVALALNVLPVNFGVPQNFFLNNSEYYLLMRDDCILALYQGSETVWASNNGKSGPGLNCSLWMQEDRNLVIYVGSTDVNNAVSANSSQPNANHSSSAAAWASNSFQDSLHRFFFLILQSDGTLNICDFDYALPFPISTLPDSPKLPIGSFLPFPAESHQIYTPPLPLDGYPYMPEGYFISEGSSLQRSPFNLTLEQGCNLRSKDLSRSSLILWETYTNFSSEAADLKCRLQLQDDGNLQVVKGSGDVVWQSNITGNSSVDWVLYLDPSNGNVSVREILKPSNVLWTNKAPPSTTLVVKAAPPATTLVVYRKRSISLLIVLVSLIGVCFLLLNSAFVALMSCRGLSTNVDENKFRKGGKSCQTLTLTQIKRATNNFQKEIGQGGLGKVFYGKLADGQEVAVKVLSADCLEKKHELVNEIRLLSVVHHKYLVSLVGYCLTKKHNILVYEYMSGGDLAGRLHGRRTTDVPLTWKQRTAIILQIAEGIEYLHNKCSQKIIHRDIKSNNILLSDKLIAKVGDFGLSKLREVGQEDGTHLTTLVRGTPGYLDPDYHGTGMLTEKADVYSFGVVVMEILTGLNIQSSIAHRVEDAWRSQQFHRLVDPNLNGDYDMRQFTDLIHLSILCTMKRRIDRPFMQVVVGKLYMMGLADTEEAHHHLADFLPQCNKEQIVVTHDETVQNDHDVSHGMQYSVSLRANESLLIGEQTQVS